MKVTLTSFVTIDYAVRAIDDESHSRAGEAENLSFPLGTGLMPAPLEEAMVGMSINEKITVRLSPQQAFGDVDQELIQEVPRGEFDPSTNPTPGDVFETEDEHGHPVYFIVKSSGPDTVVIDFNHPLAGREVEFAITLKEVREVTPEDFKSCSCSECGGSHSHEH